MFDLKNMMPVPVIALRWKVLQEGHYKYMHSFPRWHNPCLLRWRWFWLITLESRTDGAETRSHQRVSRGGAGARFRAEADDAERSRELEGTELRSLTTLSYRQYAGWAKWQGIMCNGYVTDDWLYLYHSLLQVRSLTVVLAISLLDRGITPVTADGNPDPLPHPQILIRNPGLIKVVYSFILIL